MRFQFFFLLLSLLVHQLSATTPFLRIGPVFVEPMKIDRECTIYGTNFTINRDRAPYILKQACFHDKNKDRVYMEDEVKAMSMFAMFLSGQETQTALALKYRTIQAFVQEYSKVRYTERDPTRDHFVYSLRTNNYDELHKHQSEGFDGWKLFQIWMRHVDHNVSLFDILEVEPRHMPFENLNNKDTIGAKDQGNLFEYRAFCNVDGEIKTLKLEVCHVSMYASITGDLAMTPPKGAVVKSGTSTHFHYYEVPNFAVMSTRGPVSVVSCFPYYDTYNCRLPDNECNVHNFAACPYIKVELYGNAFIRTIDSTYFVATGLKTFGVYNGTHTTNYVTPSSGQMLIDLPNKWMITLGKQYLLGQSKKEFNVFPVLPDYVFLHGQYELDEAQKPQKLVKDGFPPAKQHIPDTMHKDDALMILVPEALMGWDGWKELFTSTIPSYITYAAYVTLAYFIVQIIVAVWPVFRGGYAVIMFVYRFFRK